MKVINLCNMDMKRMMFLLMLSLYIVTSMAQSAELMRVYTDKECYLAGEKLWVKVSTFFFNFNDFYFTEYKSYNCN